MPILEAYSCRVLFRVSEPLPLVSWSGVFAGKIVYDTVYRCGFRVKRGGFFRVTPLYANGSMLWGNGRDLLEPGVLYEFRLVSWGSMGEQLVRYLVECACDPPPYIASFEEVDLKVETVEVPEPPIENPEVETDQAFAVYMVVEHLPTFYRFHGAVIAWPSPARMWASIARRLSEATGLDYRVAAKTLTQNFELTRFRGKIAIHHLTHNKKQPAFHGTAEYYGVIPANMLKHLTAFTKTAKLVGLGGSPGLGFGTINNIQFREPPFETPIPAIIPAQD